MDWLGWVLAATAAATSVPQVVRTLRTRNVDGLSLATQFAWVASWALWLFCSVQLHAWPKAAAEVVGLGVDSALLVLLLLVVRNNGALGPSFSHVARACWPLAALPLLLGMYTQLGLTALAVGLTVFDGVGMAPQLVATARSSSLAGLSLPSWGLRIAVAGGWLAYACALGYPLLAGWTFVMLPASILVFARICWTRRRPRPATCRPLSPAGANAVT